MGDAAIGRKSIGPIRITNPTPWIALIILAVVLAGTETLARTSLARRWMVTPSVGTNHEVFNIKLELMADFAESGPVDCILFGNSTTAQGIDPQILGDRFQQLTGRRLRCFNFGIDAATTRTINIIARIITAQYHPKIAIFGTSPYDFLGGLRPFPLTRSKWFLYRTGRFNWTGWLTDNSAAFRYLLSHRSWMSPQYWPRLERLQKSRQRARADGFRDLRGHKRDPRRPCTHELGPIANHARVGMRQYSQLDEEGARVLGVELPFRIDHHPCYAEEGVYDWLGDQIARHARTAGITYWRSYPFLQLIPGNGWWNMGHMNAVGAASFTKWFAEQLAKDDSLGFAVASAPREAR